jgi:porcupine-like protein
VTILANLAFGILTVVHLMYLGVMFDQSDTQEEGYVWTHTVEKWQSLGFFSHYFALFALGLNFLL